MKIIDLNTWGGRAGKEKLLSFLQKYKDEADVFCLQEIWSAPYEHLEGINAGGLPISHKDIMVYGLQEISALFPSCTKFFCPQNQDNYGLLLLVSERYKVLEEGEVYVHKFKGFVPQGDVGLHARSIQYVKLERDGKPLWVLNFHGLWNGQGKGDSNDRITQSEKINAFIKTLEGEIVFCGDFNLLPETKSMLMLEDAGLRNLIAEYGITSTRTPLYAKEEKFADYILVSKGIAVKGCKVLPDVVSDHAPLYLEFD